MSTEDPVSQNASTVRIALLLVSVLGLGLMPEWLANLCTAAN